MEHSKMKTHSHNDSSLNSSSSLDDFRSTSEVDERRLVRKIDFKLLPLLFCSYFLQFLDKVIYNYANVMGIQKELKMHGNDFSWGATAFFVGYALAEFPQGALLQRFPVAKVLGINIVLWAIVTGSTAAVHNSGQLIAMRFVLGCLESVITPALIMITSAWYQKAESVPRFGFWYCGLGLGQILGGLISFAAQHARPNAATSGWRIMFASVGGFNAIVGVTIALWLPSAPQDAKFLTVAEKNAVARRLRVDHAGVGPKVLRVRSILDAFLDSQTWLLCLLTVLNVIPSGVITTYSSILINSFGFTPKQAALLNMPSGVVSIVALMLSTWAVVAGIERWFAITVASAVTLVGACLMSFSTKTNHAALLAGIYLVNTAVTPYTLILSMVGANYRGYTKKIAGGSIVAAAFSIGNIIGPQTFQARDAPQYYPAKFTLVATTAASIAVVIALRLLYGHRNSKAEKLGKSAMSHYEAKSIGTADPTADSEDSGFRYAY